MVAIAGKQVSTPDLVVMGAGALMLIDLFVPWYRVEVEVLGFTASANAFDAGFLAWFPALLVIVVAVVTALKVFQGYRVPSAGKVGPHLLLAAVSVLAVVLLLLRLLTENDFTYLGLYLAILLAAAQAAFGFLMFRGSGEAVPDFGGHGGSGGSGGPGSGPAGTGGTPPGGGYPPPPPPTA